MAGQITVQSSSILFPAGTSSASITDGPIQFSIATPAVAVNTVTFASNFISTAGPTGATTCLILVPSGNVATLTLKGITGDTGTPLNALGPIAAFLTFPASTTPTVGIAAGGAVTLTFIWA